MIINISNKPNIYGQVGRRVEYTGDNCSGCGTTPKPDRRAELEAGLDKADCINSRILAEKAALELEVARLRSVMEDVNKAHGYSGGTPIEVLSTQQGNQLESPFVNEWSRGRTFLR